MPDLSALPFEREERFIVVKRKHLTASQEADLRVFLLERRIGTVECVVIESDWPEYETVWQMIEARCTGQRVERGEAAHPPAQPAQDVAGLLARWGQVRRWISALQGGVDKQLHDDTVTTLATLSAERDRLDAIASDLQALCDRQATELARVKECLHEIDVEAFNTIPPDGKDAAFAALARIATLIAPFRAKQALEPR